MQNLKPCPFCGGRAGVVGYRVGCCYCDVWMWDTAHWNLRSDPVDQCEHGVPDGDWCPKCTQEKEL